MDQDQFKSIIDSAEGSAEELMSAVANCDSTSPSPQAQAFSGMSSSSSEEDVYTALANRERDLMLAAELGKALLEKNEELKRKNDQLVEEYTQKIEELTQERHGLKLKLENLEAEYQATVKDLQTDITQLQHALEERQQNSSRTEHEKAQSYIIEELTQQNEKLSLQLKKAAESEKSLQCQLRQLHDEMDMRRHSMHEHVQRLDALTNQMTEVCDRKEQLERRIEGLVQERDNLTCSLEESHDRVADLEKQNKRQKSQLADQEKNIQELQERNMQLQERLSGPCSPLTSLEGSSTLFSELQMSGLAQAMSTESLDEPGAVKIGQQVSYPAINFYSTCHVDSSVFDDDDDIECDDVDYAMVASHFGYHVNSKEGDNGVHNRTSPDVASQKTDTSTLSSLEGQNEELRQEILEVYRQLKHMVMELRGTGDKWSPDAIQIHDMQVGSLLTVLKDLRDVVFSSVQRSAEKDSLDGQSLSADLQDYLEHQDMKIQDLKRDVAQAQAHVTKTVRELEFKDEQIQRYTEQVKSLTARMKEQHSCIERLQQQIDKMVDSNYDVTADDILHNARSERDHTLKQLSCVECELDKCQQELRQMDEQLTAAIQQKLELSQQLELWQVDMQELIDKQVSKRMRDEKKQEEERKILRKQQNKQQTKQTTPSKSRFSLFKKSQ